ncbi:MAG: RIP metalloprotease RseP [Anaerolineae bacterium]|nr:RIP metalloprotease RseP [Anaerolineae bacterium]
MTDFLLGVASFGLVLIPLIIIHEFGHFIAAKLSGITVLEFGIGFPPRATILYKGRETLYTLNWLPIGGFVRPFGEDFVKPKTEAEMSLDWREVHERGISNPKSVFQANPWQRMFFMAAGPGINLVAALALFILVALIGQPFARADVTIYEVLAGSPAEQAGLLPGDVILQVNGDKVESADEFNDMIRDNTGEPVDLVIERDGEQVGVSLTASVVDSADVERVYITNIERDMPAYDAGFEVEDLIVAVDGVEVTSLEELQDYTKARKGVEIEVAVLRGSDKLVIPVTPKEDSEGVPRMGIGITGVKPAIIGLTAVNRDAETYTKALPLGKAIETGVDEFVDLHRLMADFVKELFAGNMSANEARPLSPVGIGQIGGPVLEQSLDEEAMYPIVMFAALISVALAITNLLPVPGLDGGRILFVIIELIRGKPMEPEREGIIHFIGLLLMLALIAFALVNDIVNPIDVGNLK